MKRITTTHGGLATTAAGALVIAGLALGAGSAFADGATPSTQPSSPAAQNSAQPLAAAPGSARPPAPAAAPGSGVTPPAPPKAGQAPPVPQPHIDGTVESASSSTVKVRDPEGFLRVVQVGPDTTVTENGRNSDVSSIQKGDHVHATGTVDNDETSLDAVQIMVGDPGPGAGPGGRPGAGPAGGPNAGPKGAPAPAPGTQQGQQGQPGQPPALGAAPTDAPTAAPTAAPSDGSAPSASDPSSGS